MTTRYVIYAPVGAFGNHVRWLTLLDDQYIIKFSDGAKLKTANEKVDYILTKVYDENRSYHNWLEYEWQWRGQLNSLVLLTHDMSEIFDGSKSIGLTIDPDLAYRCYVKFNIGLNGVTKDDFLKKILKMNQLTKLADRYINTFKSLNSSILYQEKLNDNFYQQLLEFFRLRSKYQHAQEIHKSWFKLHQQSEKEFLSTTN